MSLRRKFNSHKHITRIVYKKKCKKISGYEKQIDLDIQRTFRNHVMYYKKYSYGQCQLFRILVAFANTTPKVGYCQGLSYFVAIILNYFPEYDCFIILKNIFKKNELTTIFDKNLSGLL